MKIARFSRSACWPMNSASVCGRRRRLGGVLLGADRGGDAVVVVHRAAPAACRCARSPCQLLQAVADHALEPGLFAEPRARRASPPPAPRPAIAEIDQRRDRIRLRPPAAPGDRRRPSRRADRHPAPALPTAHFCIAGSSMMRLAVAAPRPSMVASRLRSLAAMAPGEFVAATGREDHQRLLRRRRSAPRPARGTSRVRRRRRSRSARWRPRRTWVSTSTPHGAGRARAAGPASGRSRPAGSRRR